jgi:hypothetical protein
MTDAAEKSAEVVHRCPPEGTSVMPCCGRTPFEVATTDRLTVHAEHVTCETESGTQRAAVGRAWFEGYAAGNLDGYFGTRDERDKSPYADLDPHREQAR